MVSALCLFVSIVVSVSLKGAESQLTSTIDRSSLLNIPPYYSYLGYDRPASLDDYHYQQLLQISDEYDLEISDLYQLYDLSSTGLPHGTSDLYINIIQQVAQSVEMERRRQGLYPSSYFYSPPVVDPIVKQPYILQRRGIYDSLSNMYNQGTSAASELFSNAYNMADTVMSRTSQAFSNSIHDVMNTNAPSLDMDYAENLGKRMISSLRNMI